MGVAMCRFHMFSFRILNFFNFSFGVLDHSGSIVDEYGTWFKVPYNNGFILSLWGLFGLGLIMPNPIVGSECHPHNGKSRCWIKMPPTYNRTSPFFGSAKCSTHAPTNLLFDLRDPIARIENNLSVSLFPQVLKENWLKLSDNEWWILVTLDFIKVSRRGLQHLVSCSFLSIENRCVRIYDKIWRFLIYFLLFPHLFQNTPFWWVCSGKSF